MTNSTPASPLVGKVVVASPSIGNSFYVIVRGTSHSVWLKAIESIETLENPQIFGQRGTRIPTSFDETFLQCDSSTTLIRAKRHEPDFPGDHLWFSCGRQAFFLWGGKPACFDSM